ncbi:MAG: hypothetical protein AVO35_02505 [Candidatus Aegiribacteria sp. MLS_C]|nr:MAG: hypothetical protein AVO35_02505 [Candidatus Aegiribacteria sp. MLS_C]
MLESLFGSRVRELVLLHIHENGSGYSREIARLSGVPQDSVHKQLRRLESAGVLRSREVGRTVVYSFSEGFPLLRELGLLLEGVRRHKNRKIGEFSGKTRRRRSGNAIVRKS